MDIWLSYSVIIAAVSTTVTIAWKWADSYREVKKHEVSYNGNGFVKEISGKLDRIATDVSDLKKDIRGNGRPGLLADMVETKTIARQANETAEKAHDRIDKLQV